MSPESIILELSYSIASARADKIQLLSLMYDEELPEDKRETLYKCTVKTLKKMKKQGRIDFYVDREGFLKEKTEANYLINRFPNITDSVPHKDFMLIVKL